MTLLTRPWPEQGQELEEGVEDLKELGPLGGSLKLVSGRRALGRGNSIRARSNFCGLLAQISSRSARDGPDCGKFRTEIRARWSSQR
eukprot:jgi/Botrbrau1/20390/Bobra.0006s0051.1